jgi:hypothetical protein
MKRASRLAEDFLAVARSGATRFDLTPRIKPLRYCTAKMYEDYVNMASERRLRGRDTQLPRRGARAIVLITPSNNEYKPREVGFANQGESKKKE